MFHAGDCDCNHGHDHDLRRGQPGRTGSQESHGEVTIQEQNTYYVETEANGSHDKN